MRPHKERYYLFTDKSDPEYVARRDVICDLYTATLPADEIVVCFDEQTGLQALGLPKRLPHGGRRSAASGHPALLEHQYVRHGSRSLSAVIRPDNGSIVCAEVFPSRGYDSTCAISMMQSVLFQLPACQYQKIHVVMDNGPTHRSAAMVAFLASPEAERLHVVYTPTHASWLNLAENFLSRFYRRYLAGKRYDSLEHFDSHLYDCIDDYPSRGTGYALGLQSAHQRAEFAMTQARELAQELLRHLSELDALAAQTLRLKPRDQEATFSVMVDGQDVPLFRTTPGPEGLRLTIRSHGRWRPTPETGSPEAIAELLAGQLRFVWFLDAEEADHHPVENL